MHAVARVGVTLCPPIPLTLCRCAHAVARVGVVTLSGWKGEATTPFLYGGALDVLVEASALVGRLVRVLAAGDRGALFAWLALEAPDRVGSTLAPQRRMRKCFDLLA